MEILIIFFKSILDIALYIGQEMINNPEITIISLLAGIGFGIVWTLFKWFKDTIVGR